MSNLVNPNVFENPLSPADMRARAQEVAVHLSMMSNANRLMVLCHLLDGEMTVGALLGRLELSQSALSQHLARLREADLVATRRDGQTIYYRIADPRVMDMMAALYKIYCQPE